MKRLAVPTGWAVSAVASLIAAVAAWAYFRDDFAAMQHRQSSVINWALRLPVERRRARLAGYSPKTPVETPPPAAQNAAAHWELLDAEVRANDPGGKLPPIRSLFYYANPRLRPKQDRKKALEAAKVGRQWLASAQRAAIFPDDYAPRPAKKPRDDEMEIALFFAGVFCVEAVEARRRGDDEAALRHLQNAQAIARQFAARSTFNSVRRGYGVECVLLGVVREGLTDPDTARRRSWAKRRHAFSELLRSSRTEQRPLAQYTAILRDDYRTIGDDFTRGRKTPYKPLEPLFPGSIPPIVLWLDRLDFDLENREVYDALEANNDWGTAGIAVHLRGLPKNSRTVQVREAVHRWDAYAERETKHDHDVFKPYGWEEPLRERLNRDTNRALTQAVLSHVTNADKPIPDDPFAPSPNTPLRRRDLPGNVTIRYSVGENGADDNGDFQKDIVARVLPPLTAIRSESKR